VVNLAAAHPREQAFREIYEAHYRTVLGYCARRVPPGADPADVTAETFTTAWRRFDDVPNDHVLPWLLATARRTLANLYRSEQRRRALIERLRTTPPRQPLDHHDIATTSDLATLALALAKLGERDLEILTLSVWEELPHRDIARAIDVAESTVAVRLHRARRRLAKEYAKAVTGVEHHPFEDTRRGGGS
jgi:RNA polymerase sigma-70 factor (ECF subfamily)